MRFSIAAAAAALAGVASAEAAWSHGDSWGPPAGAPPSNSSWGAAPVYVTEVVTAFTTYCPSATAITHNGETYTVTSATTLTITNCPCTVTKPVTSYAPTGAPPPYSSGKPPVPPPASTGSPVIPSASPSSSPITPATGAGSHVAAGMAGVLAVFGLVAVL